MHSATYTTSISLAQEFQDHLSNAARKHGKIDQGKIKKEQVYRSGKKGIIMFRGVLTFHTKMLRRFKIQTSLYHCHFVVHTQNHMVSEG